MAEQFLTEDRTSEALLDPYASGVTTSS